MKLTNAVDSELQRITTKLDNRRLITKNKQGYSSTWKGSIIDHKLMLIIYHKH